MDGEGMTREEITDIIEDEPAYQGRVEDFMLDYPDDADEDLVREVMGLEESGEKGNAENAKEDTDEEYKESSDEEDDDEYVSDGASDVSTGQQPMRKKKKRMKIMMLRLWQR